MTSSSAFLSHHYTLPAKLDWMVASESVSGAASRFKLGGSVAERIANRLKPKGPGVDDSLGSRRPSLCRMAAPDIDWDATIRSGFAGSNHSSSVCGLFIFTTF
ncbi:hypothetical protein Pst134EA_006909 [Puccinia striiformis f. sp. tritici]|uniref:hypothetical protein n=1 Tax=Puccinia striiformis f. sp. tritici TaxID=168172 RepID=UPI002007E1CD|nr:hypothetical protein Pst134EA_006909 [Puccinia striiformis f. sp. tritici]KAH9469622.1 hypothetical protein Pst134EA_006909 [Puccinia striiformis f. sp. tritici]